MFYLSITQSMDEKELNSHLAFFWNLKRKISQTWEKDSKEEEKSEPELGPTRL